MAYISWGHTWKCTPRASFRLVKYLDWIWCVSHSVPRFYYRMDTVPKSWYICSCQRCVGNSPQSWVKTGKSCALCSTSLTLSLFTPPIFCLQLRHTRTQTSSVAIPVPNLEKFPGYLNVLFSCVANSQERQEVVNLEVSSATPTSRVSKLLAGIPLLPT